MSKINYQVIATNLNIRSGPGVSFPVIGTLTNGDEVVSVEIVGWVPLELADGRIGWVSRQYLQVVGVTREQEAGGAKSGQIITQSQLVELFGQPRDPAPYLKIIDLNSFAGYLGHVLDFEGAAWSCRIYGHELLEAPLKTAFRLLCEGGFAGELRTYDGCLCIRKMKGGSSYSVHSWGLAVDFNAGSNGYGQRPTLSPGFVECFTEAGFTWGGTWSTPDGMHFQLPKVR